MLSNLSALYVLKDIPFSKTNNQILEPICCLFKLIIYQHQPENTKLSIQNNSILFTIGTSYQGVSRMFTGDCREDLHNLYYPLLKCIHWYPVDRYPIFYQECKKGLEILNRVYSDNTTIHHTIIHFISIIENKTANKELLKDQNPLIDELKPFWDESEIELLQSYLELINKNISKDIYLQSLESIISEKEKKISEYIRKLSTTY